MRRFLGAGAILLTFASSVMAGGRYIEVWNPPEARGGVQHAAPLRSRSMHRPASPRPARFHTRRHATPLPTVVAKHSKAEDGLRTTEPDVTDIPRQITPEGNILRVGSREAHAHLAR